MTNFTDPKPYIIQDKSLPSKHSIDRKEAVADAIKIIRENKRIVEEAKHPHENLHR